MYAYFRISDLTIYLNSVYFNLLAYGSEPDALNLTSVLTDSISQINDGRRRSTRLAEKSIV